MEYIVLLIIVAILYFTLRYIFDIDIKKIKEIGENEKLDKITERYPENLEICKWYLRRLNNENVTIEEDKNSSSTLYLVISNKIFIANLRNSYTRIQTIAHECLHSIQSKRLLWFNFIFSNIYIIYFLTISILGIFNKLQGKNLLLIILLIFGFIFFVVRSYLEIDAMTKAKFLAKEYMENTNISSKEEIDEIVLQYDRLNDLGIKYTVFQLFQNSIIKIVIFTLICIITTFIKF